MQQARGRLPSLFSSANAAGSAQQQPAAPQQRSNLAAILAFVWRLLWLVSGGYVSFWLLRKIFGKGYTNSAQASGAKKSFFDDLFEVRKQLP